MKKNLILLGLSLSIHLWVVAQDRLPTDSAERGFAGTESYARISVNYTSDWVFAGRKDSLKLPFIRPSLAYYHKSGLFASASLSYLLTNGENRIDHFGLSAGYMMTKGDFYGGLSATAWFFNDSSYSIQAETNGNAYAFLGYDPGWIDLTVDGSVLFSNQPDFMLGAEISRMFYLVDDKFTVTPSVYALFGTQHYYSEYYSYRSTATGRGRGQGPGGGGGTVPTASVSESDKFQLLSINLSLPLSYTISKFRISFLPVYALPQNPSLVTIDQVDYKESLENTFYWSAGISYRF